jgi:hypothetical protein
MCALTRGSERRSGATFLCYDCCRRRYRLIVQTRMSAQATSFAIHAATIRLAARFSAARVGGRLDSSVKGSRSDLAATRLDGRFRDRRLEALSERNQASNQSDRSHPTCRRMAVRLWPYGTSRTVEGPPVRRCQLKWASSQEGTAKTRRQPFIVEPAFS